jgi:hypothetical protein
MLQFAPVHECMQPHLQSGSRPLTFAAWDEQFDSFVQIKLQVGNDPL